MRFQHECPALMKYMEIVRDLARRAPGLGWLSYDSQFRVSRESCPMPWDRLHPEFWIMANTHPISPSPSPATIPSVRPFRSPPRNQTSGPRYLINTCWVYNRHGQCNLSRCSHPHVCGLCRGPHSAGSCTQRTPSPAPETAVRNRLGQ